MDMNRIMDILKDRPRVAPKPVACAACEDTGWVEIDDGLDADGKRVGQPTVRRCGSFLHTAPERPQVESSEKFA